MIWFKLLMFVSKNSVLKLLLTQLDVLHNEALNNYELDITFRAYIE